MKNFTQRKLLCVLAAVVAVPLMVYAATTTVVSMESDGWYGGHTAQDLIGFHGKKPTSQRSNSAQAALTDSTNGTASTTLALTTSDSTVTIPVQLDSLTTSAADLVTSYVPGYKFKVIKVDFVTTTLGTGTSASQVISLNINSTPVTGGVLTVTLAGTNTLGKMTNGTAVTAANAGSATDAISVKVAAGGTVFTAGKGAILIKLKNVDTSDSIASLARLTNELRTSLVNKGLIKGQ